MQKAKVIVVLSILFLFSVPQQVLAKESDLSDEQITRAVERQLAADETVPSHLLDVQTRDGVVTLAGTVDSLLAKERATKNAEVIRGVRAVINRAQVQPVDRSEETLAKEIGWALARDPAIEIYQIQVQVNGKTATLTGTVDSWQEKELAGDLAQSVKGLADLTNDIVVRYQSSRPDAEIAADVKRRLDSDALVDAAAIQVQVKGGTVFLSGEVGSAAEKSRAAADAWVVGTHAVDAARLSVNPQPRDRLHQRQYVYRTDEDLREAIQDALRYDPRVRRSGVAIQVKNGEAVLSGTVRSLAAKQAAEADARNTAGVWRVRNHLKVRPEKSPTDEAIRQAILRALENDPFVDAGDIAVRVFNRKAYLSGSVDSRAERERAGEVVSRVYGVAALQNNLNPPVLRQSKSDRELQRDIEERLHWSARIDGASVAVDVNDGVATLTGIVEDFSQWRAAASNAIDAGANGVINRLKVRHGPPSLRG